MDNVEVKSKFNFTKRYVLALTIIALLSTLAYFNMDHLIKSQYDSGKLINISAQQRMLSQQISFYALYYKMDQLKKYMEKMEENHKKITSLDMPKELKKIYFEKPVELDKKVKKYLDAANEFYYMRSGRGLTYLLTHSKSLLQDLDKAAKIQVKNSENSTKYLERVELNIYLLTLLTLFLEAIFIFLPVSKKMKEEKLKDRILQEQSKFAALGEMIAIIAHQWRQPLAQLNYNTIFLKKLSKEEEVKKELENNEEIIHFMSDTIKNFEDFYKKSDNRNFNPIVSIEQVFKIVDSIMKLREIELTKDINSKLSIYGNPNSLAQVILSIIQNSLDVIKLREIKNPKLKISLYDGKEYIILTIEDNAGGIKETPINKIFKPFISKKKKPSTGIGLYMSKMIIEKKFKGNIEATNTQDGAKFTIYLPH